MTCLQPQISEAAADGYAKTGADDEATEAPATERAVGGEGGWRLWILARQFFDTAWHVAASSCRWPSISTCDPESPLKRLQEAPRSASDMEPL